jgi:hypothetical protein
MLRLFFRIASNGFINRRYSMKRRSAFLLLLVICPAALAVSLCPPAFADTITVSGIYDFRDNRSANSVNIYSGDRRLFGAAKVLPDGFQGTKGTATKGTTTIPLYFHPYSTAPHDFETSVLYNAGRTGPWLLTFTNPAATEPVTVNTQGVLGAPLVPFAQNVAISGSGLTPTFAWTMPTIPDGLPPNGFKLLIWDLERTIGQGGTGPIADITHRDNLSVNETGHYSYTVPATFSSGKSLEQGHAYSFEISPVRTRDNTPYTGVGNSSILSQSRSFFDFTPLPESAPPNVYLPIVIPGDTTVYSFHADVVEGQQIFIDPMVAIGYDYAIGARNPYFDSVTLPTGIQSDPFDLYLFDGTDYHFRTHLAGGETFVFDGSGVDRFRVLGIDLAAGLDPNNSLAFITGLTFEGSGEFTGTMIPITTNVPEPGMMVLLLTGFCGIASVGKRLKSNR